MAESFALLFASLPYKLIFLGVTEINVVIYILVVKFIFKLFMYILYPLIVNVIVFYIKKAENENVKSSSCKSLFCIF